MLKSLHRVCAVLLAVLGVVHTSLTPVFYARFNANAMWFAGAGLAMSLAGLLNIVLSRDAGRDRFLRLACYIVNVVFLVFGVLTVQVVPEPQAYFALLLLATIAATSFTLASARSDRR